MPWIAGEQRQHGAAPRRGATRRLPCGGHVQLRHPPFSRYAPRPRVRERLAPKRGRPSPRLTLRTALIRSAGAARSITIDFLETNLDFIDGIIRPWIITASYNGLIELDKAQSIKADIEMVQYTKGVGRPVRKIHSFLNCVPYSVQNNSLDYDAEKVIKRTVGWIYNHYTYRLLQGEETGIAIGRAVSSAMDIGRSVAAALPVNPPRVEVVNPPRVEVVNPPRVIPVDSAAPWAPKVIVD